MYSFAGYALYGLIVAWDKFSTVQYVLAGLYLTIVVLVTAVFFKLVCKSVKEGQQKKLKGKDEVGIVGSIRKILKISAVIITIAGLSYSYTPEHYLFLSGLVLLGFFIYNVLW